MDAGGDRSTSSANGDSNSTLKDATLVRRVPGFVIYTSYDGDGRLLGETSLPMKPMFSDAELIEAGFLSPA